MMTMTTAPLWEFGQRKRSRHNPMPFRIHHSVFHPMSLTSLASRQHLVRTSGIGLYEHGRICNGNAKAAI